MPEQKRTKQKKQGRKPQRFETLQSERLNSVQCRAATGEQLENQDEIPNQIGLLLRAHFQLSWLRLYFWCSYTAHYSSRLPPPWGCFCQWGLGGALGLWWWEYGGTLVGTMMVGNPTSSLSRSCNPPPVVSEFGLVGDIHLSGDHCCRALDIWSGQVGAAVVRFPDPLGNQTGAAVTTIESSKKSPKICPLFQFEYFDLRTGLAFKWWGRCSQVGAMSIEHAWLDCWLLHQVASVPQVASVQWCSGLLDILLGLIKGCTLENVSKGSWIEVDCFATVIQHYWKTWSTGVSKTRPAPV